MTTRCVLAEAGRVCRNGLTVLAAAAAVTAAMSLAAAPTARAGDGKGDDGVSAQLRCLAKAIYFEARGEPHAGKLAVAHVVMNRVSDGEFPDRVCEVVKEGGQDVLHRCQFSWWCDGNSTTPANAAAWEESLTLARKVFWDHSDDPTGGALWFHADYVAPAWKTAFVQGPKIGLHIFYRRPVPDPDPDSSPQVAETP